MTTNLTLFLRLLTFHNSNACLVQSYSITSETSISNSCEAKTAKTERRRQFAGAETERWNATCQCPRIPRNSIPRDCSSLGTSFYGQPTYFIHCNPFLHTISRGKHSEFTISLNVFCEIEKFWKSSYISIMTHNTISAKRLQSAYGKAIKWRLRWCFRKLTATNAFMA
jgi:hypothetical protein